MNRSVLGLIVKRMNGIEIKDAMKHINRIHEFVYSLHEQGTLNLFASEDTRMHVLSLGGISSDFFRAIMHPNVLESNAKAISDFYFQHLSSQTICSIDERIFIGPPDARSMSRNGTNSPKKKRNREEETATEHHANKRHAGNPLPGSNVPSLRSRPLPMSVLHDNWLHGVIHNRPAGPSDQVVRFFTRSSDGGEIIRKKHELTMQIMQSFMYASFRRAGVVEVNNSSSSSSSMAVTSNVRSGIFVSTPKSMHIESSCKQAVQLFWVMVENVLTVESARLSPMSSQKQMKRIGKLLKSDSFHRALLACSVEVVFVANKLYSHLFPQSLATLEVKPLIMFTVIEKFVAAWKSAETIAEDDFLVLIGIKPDNPATGYGYIKPNKKISIKADLDIYEVDSFIEKPNINDAMKYVDDGYLWNSGMFVFKAKVFMDLLKKYQLEMYNSLLNVSDTNIKDVYASFPNLSMDYGLAEKVKKIAVVPVGMGWNDLGSWNSIYENGQKDKDGNVCHGTVFNLDTKDSLIWSEDNLIATIGLSNIIAVQTPDAILISDRNRSEEIKLLVENLRRSNPKVIEENVTIYRPWGAYQVLSENENFKVKRIIVKPKSKLSLQMHKYRSEHWVVVSGTATIINNNNEKSTLKINESTYIPKEQKHRLMNDTDSDLIIIEVQCGEYVGEDDILRFDDFYGRETDG